MRDYRAKTSPKPLTAAQKEAAKKARKDRVAANPEKYRKLRSAAWHRRKEQERAYVKTRLTQNPAHHRERDLKRKYGITLAHYLRLMDEQSHKCAVCGEPSNGRRFDVDHCHSSGRVRGLLCRRCNLILGHAQDEPEVLMLAAGYLASASPASRSTSSSVTSRKKSGAPNPILRAR